MTWSQSWSHNHVLQKNIKDFSIMIFIIFQTPKHVWLQYNIKSPWLFGIICAQNSIGSLELYNELNSTKSPWLFHFIWVKICSYIHICPLSNYLLQTPQIYLDFTQSFSLSKSGFLYSVSLMKYSLGDLF